jgi:phospholipid/cholesterol/gamma-HCH transport system substrate-binding protein
MQQHTKLEISVGVFVVLGGLSLAYLSFTLGGFEWGNHQYPLEARFSSVGDLKLGDAVKVAGVSVGEVTAIRLVDYAAQVSLAVQAGVTLPDDTIASIQTSGLLGDAYVSLSPGASERDVPAGGSISRTESAISISELLAKYAFGSTATDPEGSAGPAGSPTSDVLE